MRKKLKTIGTGIGAAGVSITTAMGGAAATCTGVCGACGLGCAAPIAGVAAAGYIFFVASGKKEKTYHDKK